MTLTPDQRQAIGDAWGRLAGLTVDACKSHHASHCEPTTETPEKERRRDTITHAKAPCAPSTVGVEKYETLVNLPPTTAPVVLGVSQMHVLAPGAPMSSAAALEGEPAPNQFPAAPYGTRVKLRIDPATPVGLYVGRVSPATGNTPNVPALIFMDGMD